MQTGYLITEAQTGMNGAVCVIDGDQGVRDSLSMLMGTLGVQAYTFATAEDFLDRVGNRPPSLLITELSLSGMGGFALKKTLDARGVAVSAIGLTGEVNGKKEREASRLGFLGLVEKPFVYWSVLEHLRDTVGKEGCV